jgi:hypothetical protein
VVHVDGNTINVRRSPGRTWCTGETPTQLRNTAAANPGFSVMGITGAVSPTGEERVAWTERNGATNVGQAYVLEGGPDGRLGTADDRGPYLVESVTGGFVAVVKLGGNALAYRSTHFANGLYSGTWYVLSAGPSGFGSGTTLHTPDAATQWVDVQSDGARALFVRTDGILRVRTPGANGVYEDAGDDVEVTWDPGNLVNNVLTAVLEGGHAVLIGNTGSPPIQHWSAGPDGVFGTGDDSHGQLLASSANRTQATLYAGYLYYAQNNAGQTDLHAVDLSTLRWEAISDLNSLLYRPRANHQGTLFFETGGGMVARSPQGSETRATQSHNQFDADGSILATNGNATLYAYVADATGTFFSSNAWRVTVLTNYGGNRVGGSGAVAVGENHVVVDGWESATSSHSVYLADLDVVTPAVTRVVRIDDLAPVNGTIATDGASNVGVSARHVMWSCSAGICVREPGPNGILGDGDDVAFVLQDPVTHGAVSGYGFRQWRDRVLCSSPPDGVVVIDAGPDHAFNTADDDRIVLGAIPLGNQYSDLAGDVVAWITYGTGTAAGFQIWQADLVTGARRQLTDYYSSKNAVSVEPSGRVFWNDAVIPTPNVFVHAF